MTHPKLHKKLFAFGIALFLISFPLLLHLEVEATDFFKHLLEFASDKGILCTFFLVGIILMLAGVLLKKLSKA
jgi:hypothetical protein